jgi:hypothetical protein
MSNLAVYNPLAVEIVWGGVVLDGVADGTFIEAARNQGNSQTKVGAYGDPAHTKIVDKTGTVTVTFLQQSESNKILSAVQLAQDTSDDLIRLDMSIRDKSGGFLCYIRAAHIMTVPSMSLGDDSTNRAWVWFADRLDYADTIPEVGLSAGRAARVASAVSTVEETFKIKVKDLEA